MRTLLQWALVCAVWAIGAASSTRAQEALPDPNVVQAGHFFHKSEQAACPEVNVILEMEPAKAAPKSDNSTPQHGRRCCLFRRHAQGAYGAEAGYGAVGNIVFTPALINLNQGAANIVSANFGASIDLSALRSLHEIEMHVAAYGAQQAAQQAAKEHMDQAFNRLQGSLQKLGTSAGKGGEGAGADTTLNAQLAKLDGRLKDLEEMVKAHHETMRVLVQITPKKAQGKITTVLDKDNRFGLKPDSSDPALSFLVDGPDRVRMIDKDGSFPAKRKLENLQVGDQVTVTYEEIGNQKIAKEIRLAK
jgi:hypothetical protein